MIKKWSSDMKIKQQFDKDVESACNYCGNNDNMIKISGEQSCREELRIWMEGERGAGKRVKEGSYQCN